MSEIARPARPTLFPFTTLFRSHKTALVRRRIAPPQRDAARIGADHRKIGRRRRSLHRTAAASQRDAEAVMVLRRHGVAGDRKSTRLNSSHPSISYAVFCLKKKK